LIQRTTMEAPQQTYVLHRARRSQEDDQLLHERCEWAGSAGGDDSSDRTELDGWIKTLPQPWTVCRGRRVQGQTIALGSVLHLT
jgi:hypothetical protein